MLPRRYIFISLICVGLASNGQAKEAQEVQDISSLFSQLKEPRTTDRASRLIVQLANKDPDARSYIIKRLPAMIGADSSDKVWMNAVRLAGQLKAVEAIPSLQRSFSRGQLGRPANTMLGTEMQLDDDIVGKALAQIGEPSVLTVTEFLTSDDLRFRRRAVKILTYIGSPAAHKALRVHLPLETDQRLKGLIEAGLKGDSESIGAAPKAF